MQEYDRLAGATPVELGVYREEIARRWPLLLIPPGLLLRMALNTIDGVLAREHSLQSPLRGFLNELGNVCSDAALYLPFALVPGVAAPLVVLVVILGIIGEMASVVAVQIGAGRRYDGPMGKSERAFVFGLLALLLGLGVPAGWWIVFYALQRITANHGHTSSRGYTLSSRSTRHALVRGCLMRGQTARQKRSPGALGRCPVGERVREGPCYRWDARSNSKKASLICERYSCRERLTAQFRRRHATAPAYSASHMN